MVNIAAEMAYLETKKYLSTIGFLVIVLCLFPAMDDATAVVSANILSTPFISIY
jgi:nitrate reductase NapE component